METIWGENTIMYKDVNRIPHDKICGTSSWFEVWWLWKCNWWVTVLEMTIIH